MVGINAENILKESSDKLKSAEKTLEEFEKKLIEYELIGKELNEEYKLKKKELDAFYETKEKEKGLDVIHSELESMSKELRKFNIEIPVSSLLVEKTGKDCELFVRVLDQVFKENKKYKKVKVLLDFRDKKFSITDVVKALGYSSKYTARPFYDIKSIVDKLEDLDMVERAGKKGKFILYRFK